MTMTEPEIPGLPATPKVTGLRKLLRTVGILAGCVVVALAGTIGKELSKELFANNSAKQAMDAAATNLHSLGALKRYFPDDYGDLVALTARGQLHPSIPTTTAATAQWTQAFLASHAQQEAAAPAEDLAAETSAFAALVSQLQLDGVPTCAAMAGSGASSDAQLSPTAQKLADAVTEARIVATYKGRTTPTLHEDPSEADTVRLRATMEGLMPGSFDRLANPGVSASQVDMCGTVVALYRALSALDPGAQARFVRRQRLSTHP